METVKQTFDFYSGSNPPNWWEGDYLYYMLSGPWSKLRPFFPELGPKLKDIAFKIFRSKRFNLVNDYSQFDRKLIDIHFDSGGTIIYRGKIYAPDTVLSSDILGCCNYILDEICGFKEKLLVGVKSSQPLWVDIPTHLYVTRPGQNYWQYDKAIGIFVLHLLPLLSGESRQQAFDRLILPAPDRWPRIDDWTIEKSNNILSTIGENLQFPEGFVNEDEYSQILAEAFLNQKYSLIDDRPVLVRLEDHPFVFQIILMQKGEFIIAKICTFSHEDFITIISLKEIIKMDFIDIFNEIKKKSRSFSVIGTNWALQALIASIYRDLVTVEEKEIGTRRVAGKKKPDLKTKQLDPLEPKLFTTSWQYIPRRQYVYNRPDDSSYMDREPLSEADQHKQRAIRKWHMVCGHIRRYREKPDWMASGDKQDQALADGVILRLGETYVRPHARNAGALEELGEIDINSIPHYMRRKMAS